MPRQSGKQPSCYSRWPGLAEDRKKSVMISLPKIVEESAKSINAIVQLTGSLG